MLTWDRVLGGRPGSVLPAPSIASPATLASRLTTDGRESDAHLQLLSAFLAPQALESWLFEPFRSTLGESPRRAVQRWIDAGLLQHAPAVSVFTARLSQAQVRLLLRERGLRASGTKLILVTRLLQADPQGVRSLALGQPHYLYVGGAAELNRSVPPAQRPAPPAVVKTALRHLGERSLAGAVRAVAAYHAAGIFPSGAAGAAVEWTDRRHLHFMTRLLYRLFTSWPAIVDDIPVSLRGTYRVAAGMMALLGTHSGGEWIAPGTPPHSYLSTEAVTRMVLLAGHDKLRRRQLRDAGVSEVRIRFPEGPQLCPACQAISNLTMDLRRLQPLPLANCSCAEGFAGQMEAMTSPFSHRANHLT